MAPGVPDTPNQARVNIGPTALRNMLEHFPMNKGTKADPQIIWSFSNENVSLRTCESSMDRGQLDLLPLLHNSLIRQGTNLDRARDQRRRI